MCLFPSSLQAAEAQPSAIHAVRLKGRSHAAKAQLVIAHLREAFGAILNIGDDGLLDTGRFNAQQMARFEAYVTRGQQASRDDALVIDAASDFIARGGMWNPGPVLLRRIEDAAMGRVPCGRVRVTR